MKYHSIVIPLKINQERDFDGILPNPYYGSGGGICDSEQYIQLETVVERYSPPMQIPKGSKRNKKGKVEFRRWNGHKIKSVVAKWKNPTQKRKEKQCATDRSFLGLSGGCIWELYMDYGHLFFSSPRLNDSDGFPHPSLSPLIFLSHHH